MALVLATITVSRFRVPAALCVKHGYLTEPQRPTGGNCFCNQHPSDVNFVSMLVGVSPLNFAEDEERQTTEKPMGGRSLYEPASHLLSEVSLSNHAVHKNPHRVALMCVLLAHNPEVVGSNPTPATSNHRQYERLGGSCSLSRFQFAFICVQNFKRFTPNNAS